MTENIEPNIITVTTEACNAPSIPKIKVKSFGGKPSENAEQWLFQFSLSFSNASDETKKNALAQLLEEDALTWYYQLYQSSAIPSQFSELQKLFLNRFRPQKSRLCQMTSLDANAYITEFTTIASGVTFNDPRTPIQMFINGVHEEIRKYLIGREFTSLFQVEQCLRDLLQCYDGSIGTPGLSNNAPVVYAARAKSFSSNPKGPAGPGRTKLTQEQREELREKGGCFYCRQLGHYASECPEKETLPLKANGRL
jgi:hypothetical protein